MKDILVGMTGLEVRNTLNNIRKEYNVKDYGAKGDNLTDDTVAIQTTINTCEAAGGGVIYIPAGIYIIGGALQTNIGGINYKSQLYIPSKNFNDTSRVCIEIRGDVCPNMTQSAGVGGAVPPITGTILKSTILSTTPYSYVLASVGAATNYGGNNYNQCNVTDIQFRVRPDVSNRATLGGIGFYDAGHTIITRVTVFIDGLNLVNSGIPQNNCTGIAMPKALAEEMNIVQYCKVGGMESGYITGDHTFLHGCIAWACLYGYNFYPNFNSCFATKIGAFQCANSITVSLGYAYVEIYNLETEWIVYGKWYDSVYTVLDANNRFRGVLHYFTRDAATGPDLTKFIKSLGGGVHLRCYPLFFPDWTSFIVTGARDEPEGALKDLIAKLVAQGIIIDGTTAS